LPDYLSAFDIVNNASAMDVARLKAYSPQHYQSFIAHSQEVRATVNCDSD
jgi:hypothetical protein